MPNGSAGVPVGGGFNIRDYIINSRRKRPPPMSLFGDPATFTAAARTQASDYDRIMKSYSDFLDASQTNPLTATSVTPQMVTPQTAQYRQSQDVTGSLANLSNLAATGGLSPAEIADIRARDISPIRSIYANAQQNVERQRALAGGYSPNYNAVQAQMARDEAEQIAERTTAVNAGIAEMRAKGRLSAAPAYAGAAGSEAGRATEAAERNAAIINQINEA
ncbi:hypothetical protein HYZ97_03730, partial [Candidatus Pacearchaeota archaeon]|nr:hypothetical protein [Candidatus Pacearchaeota archaeon]